MIFNEQINMSEPLPITQNTPPVVPNGNGRPQFNTNNPQPPATAAVTSSTVGGNHTPAPVENAKPKSSTNSTARNYVRKPINKK
jgi:hypothetical protein